MSWEKTKVRMENIMIVTSCGTHLIPIHTIIDITIDLSWNNIQIFCSTGCFTIKDKSGKDNPLEDLYRGFQLWNVLSITYDENWKITFQPPNT